MALASLKATVRKVVPRPLERLAREALIRLRLARVRRKHMAEMERLRDATRIKVAFFLIHESVWKCEVIYQLMREHPRFEPVVVICPCTTYAHRDRLRAMDGAYRHFSEQGYEVIYTYDEQTGQWLDIKSVIDPDIVFFTNPWNITARLYRIEHYLDRLTCYVPYGYKNSDLYNADFNRPMHNLVWRFFVETNIHKHLAEKYSINRARNVVVTGFPGTDRLLMEAEEKRDPWKEEDSRCKRIIWAPHHTIAGHGANLDYSTFLDYAEFMLELARKNPGNLQIAFKPHPLLRSKLSLQSVWGVQATDAYYDQWETLENGLLMEGDYMDLFMTSDALILDSSSFLIEYLHTGKPMLFLLGSESVLERFNEVGKEAMKRAYIARNRQEVNRYVDEVVMGGDDPLRCARVRYFESRISPPHGELASRNVVDHIENTLG